MRTNLSARIAPFGLLGIALLYAGLALTSMPGCTRDQLLDAKAQTQTLSTQPAVVDVFNQIPFGNDIRVIAFAAVTAVLTVLAGKKVRSAVAARSASVSAGENAVETK